MDKGARLANYMMVLRKEIMWLCRACGVEHPSLITLDHFEVLNEHFETMFPRDLLHYKPEWGVPSVGDQEAIKAIMRKGTANL